MKSSKRIPSKKTVKKKDSSFSIHDFPTAAILYSKDNVLLEWNAEACKLLGYKLNDRPELKQLKLSAQSKADKTAGVHSFITKKGEERKIEVVKKKVTLDKKICYLELLTDRTSQLQQQEADRKRIDNELLIKNKTIDNMLQSTTDGFFATDAALNFIMVSPVFARLAKRQPQDMVGKNMVELFPFMKGGELIETYRHALRTQKSSTFEYASSLTTKQIYQISIYPSEDSLFIYYKDVSLPKIVEAELRDTSELFRRLSDNVPGMIYNFYFTAEDFGEFPFVSSGSLSLLGIPASALMKDSSLVFKMIHADDYPQLAETLREAYHTRKRWISEFRVTLPDGSVKWIAGESHCYMEKDGKSYWYGFLHDVSRQKNVQTELREVYDELNAILNSSTDSTFYLDSEYRIKVFNKTAEDNIRRLYNNRQVRVGESMLEYTSKESLADFKSHLGRALKGEPVVTERENTFGETRLWSHIRYLPVVNGSGNITGVSVNITDISSRKQAEQELFKSRKYFELLVNSQSSYLIRTDMEGRYTFVNAKFYDKFGFGDADLIGSNSLDTILVEDHDLCQQAVEQCFAEPGKVIPVTLRKPKKGGGFYWTEWEFVAVQDEEGNLVGVQAVGLDATERVIALQNLRENEERFRTLISDINIGILLQGPRSEVRLANRAAMDLLGLNEDQLLGRTSYNPAWNIVREDGSEFATEEYPVLQAIATKQPIRGVVMGVYRPRSNDRAWLLVDAIPRVDEDGEIKNVVCTFNNITELKKAESNLEFTRFTIDHTSDAVYWIRPDASIADMNLAAHSSLGYSSEEMLKMSLTDFDQSYSDKSWYEFWQVLKERKSLTNISRQKRKDGTEVDVEINSNFITFRGQEFNCAFVRDITERKKSEQALMDSNDEKDILIKEIHHRVKNNLQLISSILFIKMSRMNESEMKDFLENTRQKIRSIALIHERLLQTGSVDLVDIADYLGKLISDLEMSNTRPELSITITHLIDHEEMNLDTAIYCGLIINELVINSIKHAFANRTEGHIKISLRKMGDMQELIIRDDGISIPETIIVGQTGSFGMQMLEIFIKQLNGKLNIDRKNGTAFHILFRPNQSSVL